MAWVHLQSVSWQVVAEDKTCQHRCMHDTLLPPTPHPNTLASLTPLRCPQQHSFWSQITTEHKSYQWHKSMKNRSFHVHVARATLLSQAALQRAADSVWLWNENKRSCRGKNDSERYNVFLYSAVASLFPFSSYKTWCYLVGSLAAPTAKMGIKLTKTLKTKCTSLTFFV